MWSAVELCTTAKQNWDHDAHMPEYDVFGGWVQNETGRRNSLTIPLMLQKKKEDISRYIL